MPSQKERSQLQSALLKKGFELRDGGSHEVYIFKHHGLKQAVSTIVSRGSSHKTLSKQILSLISKELHLTAKQLGEFIDCPLNEDDYAKLLMELRIIK
jgi:hypothetical protein